MSVNGKLVAHDITTGYTAVRFNRLGLWAAGDAGATVELQSITATTR